MTKQETKLTPAQETRRDAANAAMRVARALLFDACNSYWKTSGEPTDGKALAENVNGIFVSLFSLQYEEELKKRGIVFMEVPVNDGETRR